MRLSKMVLLLGAVCSFSVMDGYGMNEDEIGDDQPIEQNKKQLASFSTLPQDMIFSIYSYLQPKDMMRLFTSNKLLYQHYNINNIFNIIKSQGVECDGEYKFFKDKQLYEIANELICNQDKNILLLHPDQYKKIQGGNIGLLMKLYQYHLDSFKWEAKYLINKIHNYQDFPLRLVLKHSLTWDPSFIKPITNLPEKNIFIQGTKWDGFLNDLISCRFNLIDEKEFNKGYNLPIDILSKKSITDDQRFMSFLSEDQINNDKIYNYKDANFIQAQYVYYKKIIDDNNHNIDVLKDLKVLAKKGYAPAQYEFELERDGIKYYISAAQQGYPPAQCILGEIYLGGMVVAENLPEAFYWYSRAAEQENADAYHELAGMYFYGQHVKQDYKQSKYLFEKALPHEKDLLGKELFLELKEELNKLQKTNPELFDDKNNSNDNNDRKREREDDDLDGPSSKKQKQ